MVGARVRRQQVAYAEGRGLSRRRACALLSVARSTIGYVSRLIGRDADVVPPMRTLAAQYPRYGYRTIRIFLERQGHVLGTDRMYRLWRQEGLQVPKKRPPDAWLPVDRGRFRRRRLSTSGRTTSCSTRARMARR
jgi:putative transposase